MNRILPILCFLLLAFNASADRVKVRLFSNNSIDLINISFDLGTYNIYSNDTTLIEENVGNDKAVELTTQGRKVHVAINGYDYGSHSTVNFRATDTACILCLNPRNIKQRTYEGNLSVSVNKRGHLQIINDVEFETYIAGVVQSSTNTPPKATTSATKCTAKPTSTAAYAPTSCSAPCSAAA